MDKEYTVLVEAANGSRYAVQARKSRMQRVLGQLTKSAVKAWLNEVSRQQSLGVKGMTCVWQVRSSLLQCSVYAGHDLRLAGTLYFCCRVISMHPNPSLVFFTLIGGFTVVHSCGVTTLVYLLKRGRLFSN